MGKLPSTLLRRPSLAGSYLPTAPNSLSHTPLPSHQPPQCLSSQVRHATFVPRSRRPYQFTQLVQLSDGSTFTVRTTSPLALYKSDKDSRNHILWQPTNKSLRNVEVDEAGKLAAFRERYGTSWDLDAPAAAKPEEANQGAAAAAAVAPSGKDGEKEVKVDKGESKKPEAKAAAPVPAEAEAPEDPFDSLVDLISAYATDSKSMQGGLSAKDQAKKDKSGKKK